MEVWPRTSLGLVCRLVILLYYLCCDVYGQSYGFTIYVVVFMDEVMELVLNKKKAINICICLICKQYLCHVQSVV